MSPFFITLTHHKPARNHPKNACFAGCLLLRGEYTFGRLQLEEMILEIDKAAILNLVCRQVDNNFTLNGDERKEIEASYEEAIVNCEENFLHTSNKYYSRTIDGKQNAYFNPFHSVQWMIFLYYLAHSIFKKGSSTKICDKLYYLNKLLNGLDLFYAVETPKHFGAEHPVGSVMGRAKYGDNFYFYQGCTVGGTHSKDGSIFYPVIDENVRMYANSSVLGKCHIGRNVQIGAGALVKNQDVPDNCIVFGQSPDLTIKQSQQWRISILFQRRRHFWRL